MIVMESNSRVRPLFLVDLDDTLFQTARKMPEGARKFVATLDSKGQPNGYMDPVQRMFALWLFEHADVVPVTARGVDSFLRVQLPFTNGAICSHGGVILRSNGEPLEDWSESIRMQLEEIQGELRTFKSAMAYIGEKLDLSLRITMIQADGLDQFLVVKQSNSTDDVLAQVQAELQSGWSYENFYLHRNGNNLAIIPNFINKQSAVQAFLERDRAIHGERPVLGFGDSLTDHGFMTECHWWGTPRNGQLASFVQENIK